MLSRKKGSSGSSNKKDESKQKGAKDEGGTPPVPASGGASEGACGQSTAKPEETMHPEQSQHTDILEEAGGGGSSQAIGGHRLSKKGEEKLKKGKEKQEKEREKKEAERREKQEKEREKKEAERKEKELKEERKREREKQKKEAERQEKERKERERQEKERKKMEKQRNRGFSLSRKRNSSENSQPPNETNVPQGHRTPPEGSQGDQAITGAQGATLEEVHVAEQPPAEAREVDVQTVPVDDTPVFVEPESGQTTASETQQDEKDRRIAELEQLLEETKTNRIQKLETEMQILQAKEAEMNSQHQEHIHDLRTALQRKQAEIEKLSDNHATQIQTMQDDHSKKMLKLDQERKQSEKEKDEEARVLKQSLHEQEKLNQESEEKIEVLRRESVQLKEELETKLKENEEELCAVPLNHHLEETKRQQEDLEKKHALELSQLRADLKEKERLEIESREEADNLHRVLNAAREEHAKDLEQLRELKHENEQKIDLHRWELEDANEKHTDEVRRLQATLKEEHEQEVNRLREELKELATKNAEKVEHLNAELEKKDVQYTKEIAGIKEEYENKHKVEEHQKEAEVERKVKRQDAVSSGRLRELKTEIENWKKDCKEKDTAIAGLTKELEKLKEETQEKDRETEEHVETMKAEMEKLQHEQKRQHVAEASKKQKEHDQLLEKTKEIESLRKELHIASTKLTEKKGVPETIQKLTEQLQEKDRELKAVATEVTTLRSSYKDLRHQYEQLTVEVKMKNELTENSELFSSNDPCDTTVLDTQDQHTSDPGTPCTEEEKDFQSTSESSFHEREEGDSTLANVERMTLHQRVATAEEDAKQANSHLQKLSEENETLQAQLKKMSEQVQRFEEWHRLVVDKAQQVPADVSKHETIVVNREKHTQLKKNFVLLTEKNMKLEKSHRQLLEKLEDRDKQVKELQLNVGHNSVVPKVYESLSSEEISESAEELSHDAALRELIKQNTTISELRNRVASLQTKMSTFERTAAEHSKLEQHGKEQSKAVKEWRQKCEVAERKLTEYEDELQALRGEVSAKQGQKDSIEIQQLQADYEAKIESLNTAMNVASAKCTTQELACHQLKEENQGLLQQLQELEQQCTHLKDLYGTVTQQLSQLGLNQSEVDAIKEQAAAMNEAMTAKSVEAMDLKKEKETLQKMLKGIKEELERQKIEAETYKEDFEKERNDRAELASRYNAEKAKESVQHQTVVDDLQDQIKDLKDQTEVAKGEIHRLTQELITAQEKNEESKDSLQVTLIEKKSLEDAHFKLDDKYREKEAHLEKALAQKSDLEEQLEKSRANHDHEVEQLQRELQHLTDQLHSERTELEQQIAKVNDDIAAWKGDCQAKTQQVKQYKKQVDTFRGQVDGLTAELRDNRVKFAEYEKQLSYYQEQVRQLDEDSEQKAAMVKAQLEAEMLNVNRDLERLRREKAMWEMTKQAGDQRGAASTCDEQAIAHVQSLTQQLEHLKQLNHTQDSEIQIQRSKYLEVTEKCEIYWNQIDGLQQLLKQNGISVPRFELPSEMKGRYPTVHPSGQQGMQPGAAVPRSPHTPHNVVPKQMGQGPQGGEGVMHSLPPSGQYTASRDGAPDKSITSPAAVGQQPSDFKSQHQLVMPGGSSMPHQGGIQQHQQQYPRGYAGQGGMAALGQQNQYQQEQRGHQVWQGGHQGGGVAPVYHQGGPGHYENQQSQIPQRGMGNTNGAGNGMEPQQLAVAMPESGHQRLPSGPQENLLMQGINTEMHTVAAGVGREVDSNPELQSLSPQAPLDPNLICPMCRQQFRIGEIQKYRQHVKHCHGTA